MKRVAVIQSGKLGDMICTTPVFRAIKKTYPGVFLIACGDKINEEVLAGNPHIDKYICLSDLNRSTIKSLDIDVAILLTPHPRILWHLLAARVGKIITPRIVGGVSPYATKIYRLLSLFVTTVPHRFGHYAPQEYLNMLAPLGIATEDTKKEIYSSPEAEARAEEIVRDFKDKIKIVMSPSAGNKIKNWGGKNFAKVADDLCKKWNSVIFIIGGEKDAQEVREMVESLQADTKVVDLSMKLSIDGLKAFISKVDLFVSVDTGPVYIAEALGIPTVDIIGPMDEREQPPQGPANRLVYLKDRKAAVLHIMNARVYNYDEARRQIESITSDMVVREANELLSRYDR